MTAAVLTPFYRSRAVELGNRLWRKKVLPVGDVEYKGRTLHFTLNYLKGLAGAFTARAYDQVAFQRSEEHTSELQSLTLCDSDLVLPVGDVEYKGRTLHFTLNYLKGLAGAFTARAYDQVAFQLADAQNTHTNDPERFRGD